MNRSTLRCVVALATASFVMSACGDDDDATTGTTTTTAQATTASDVVDTVVATEQQTTTAQAAATTVEDQPTTTEAQTTTPQAVATSTAEETTTTESAVAIVDPDDDANGDGELDPFCSQQDFGAGLVMQVHCELEGLTSEIPPGVTLVDGALFGLRSSIHRSLDGISGNLIVSRDPAGGRLFVIVFQSDALFASGSASIESTDSFDNVVALVNRDFPGSVIQVRGHTDGVGDPASNLALSEARAGAVRARFLELAIQSPDVSSVGFGETLPMALEDNEEGRAFNRRVEVVIRPPGG